MNYSLFEQESTRAKTSLCCALIRSKHSFISMQFSYILIQATSVSMTRKTRRKQKGSRREKTHDWASKIPTKFRTWAITRDRICSMMFSNKCLDLGLHIDHDDDAGRSKSKQVFNLFLRINIHHQLVCIQNIPWLLVLSIESHLKWRYSVLREPFAHTTVSNLYSIYVSDTRDKKFKLYVFLHLRKGGNAQVSSGIVCYPYPYQWCDPKSGSKFW